ncbi:hypothetical protein A2141_03470 [Candidatus Woesebacteria bacterium RBG_16_40_11]|uniref:DUF5673 domain-containing protein n=1 Tax=Candidatus Woesebacteria bacterium RIFCSPHIGHO2_01_FULL_40_22 TaxID=1802499 RepID=A0A1F7YGN8_9BACT|nr:MAG: hypothetical protein A2141_03470 [Candidatus Woesebacteria bacterium RBG_16_40_11]OGM26422.1 MAG: hypothetical protein A2628_00145 [Candidatus Woesebacteria bacterium RIFCSPHIGHO2_01_FULL_40_22]
MPPTQKQDQKPKRTLKNEEEKVVETPGIKTRIEPEKTLFSWVAPARAFKRRDRDFWVTVVVIVGISGLILFLVEGFMPVILIISIVFLFYILNTVEPGKIEYKITNKGVKVEEKMNAWDIFTRFWFTKRFNYELLVLETLTITGRLELVINSKDKARIKTELSKYIVEEEAPPSSIDKAANFFAQKLPGNKLPRQ